MIDVFVSPTFERQVKALKKRYKNIGKDIDEFVSKPLKSGQVIGEQVQGVGYAVFKVRVPNRDAKRGKRGGYRIVYYLKARTTAVLLAVYAKSDQVDITASDIRAIIESFERQN
ncbi:MAG: type II toxin-antitoxin system RelE/ParE family toxin [Chloroherpetonaceae bacterium]|nr:type II toxin-antitoxin system RelE/ParE family toxin [Chloroherpetonaceae bacterium]MCS7211825.1 type II toxin-antitoxin system RelE/ParE family toxin [Chloroherpetonaceae bacterium]MDW8019958.1 type II toxin-antitoxin system RelE/ParE family toxin [Chloroherpetonaceae bacterium]MDW8466823.1 type II toxin-antitoxin system RelE/ParE family toxin [Chloroherpetonaceae bacterium]